VFLLCAISAQADTCTSTTPILDGVVFNPTNYSANFGAVSVTIKASGTTIATVTASGQGYWIYCDTFDRGNYTIHFTGSSTAYSFNWSTDRDGEYNLKDFKAAGDFATDDKNAIQSAIYFVAGKNGGKLIVPRGYYRTTGGFVLPSGIIIEGNNGSTFSSCRIELNTANTYLFKIGGNTNGISIKDILLAATLPSPGNPNTPYLSGTQGILAQGSYPNSSIGFVMRDVSLLSFEKGMEVTSTDGWQFDQVRLDHATIAQCKECIKMDTVNSDWQISNSWIGAVGEGIGINMLKTGFVLIENTIGGGPGYYWNASATPPAFEQIPIGSSHAAETYINIAGQHGTIKIDNSQCEQFKNAMVIDNEDVDNPIMVANSIFGDKIIFKKNATYVSTANFYLSDTIETWVASEQPHFLGTGTVYASHKVRGTCAVPDQSCCNVETVATPTTGSANNVRIFSTGDSFSPYNRYWCYNNSPLNYPYDFIVSGASTAYGARRYGDGTSIFDTKKVGIGTTIPGNGLSGTPSVLEVEARDGSLPWLILNRNTTTGGRRWGWVIGSDGSLFLQDIGHNNLLQVDTNGNLFPPTDNTGQIGTNSNRWAKVRATVVQSGDLVLSNKETGEQLYTIKEDENNIYFLDFRTGKEMMRLDVQGNLYLKGKIFQNQKAKTGTSAPAKKKVVKRKK
jgi:hypothetical protein